MKKERSGRAKTVPSRLGSLESAGGGQQAAAGYGGPFSHSLSCSEQAASHHNTLAHSTPHHPHTPSTLKKTVHLLSPEVLTNWYTNRKRDNLYGPRRNSISNLFFNPDKKASSPLTELRNGDKLRNSMLNLDHILLGEGVEPRHLTNGKGIVRSESAKLTTNEGKSEVGLRHLKPIEGYF